MSKLLTIAIPTWNRSKTLDGALSHLLPQMQKLYQFVDIVISNNCSTDNTTEIIKEWINKYPNIEFTVYNQSENTGFFGNIKKCKELASGQFVWILSDDDFVNENVLSNVIKVLKENYSTLGILYLNNNKIKRHNKSIIIKNNIDIEYLFNKYNYQLTLISSVIFYNCKINDNFIYNKFINSHLIGFALLIDIIQYRRSIAILSGNLLQLRMHTISGYNLYDAFVYNIFEIFDYMLKIGYTRKIVSKFKENLIKDIWVKRYFYYKAKGKLDAGLESYDITKANMLFRNYFGDTINYWLLIFPLSLIPSFIIRLSFPTVERIRNLIREGKKTFGKKK